jgi:hypothetical protein
MMDVVIVVPICRTRRPRWRRRGAGYRAQPAANRRSDASTAPAAGDRTDDRTGPGADETTPKRAFTRIVRIRLSRGRQEASGADHVHEGRYPSHSLSFPAKF